MPQNTIDKKVYPLMNEYLTDWSVDQRSRKVMGREKYIRSILANLERPELPNAILLGDPGTGKTTIVKEVALRDKNRHYFSIDLVLMASSRNGGDGSVEMAVRFKQLFNEVVNYQKANNEHLVLFMDEFHLITKVSPAALQALKPLLADSGKNNLRFIAATTYEEFDKYIREDEAITQRLPRINIEPLTDDVVEKVLENTLQNNDPDINVPAGLLTKIVQATNKYSPSEKQPRKALKILDAMEGWYRKFGYNFDYDLLTRVMKEKLGVNINWDFNVEQIGDYLNHRVIAQRQATVAITNRLYISIAGLNDETRPQASFLFTGSTGVGKTEMAKALTKVLTGDESNMIRFDMSEYSTSDTVIVLREQLATRIWAHPSGVVLFDEVEKAHQSATRLLLQVLDDARLSDRYGREVSFKDVYIILTTNVGQEVYKKYLEDNSIDVDLKGVDTSTITDSLKEYNKVIQRSLISDPAFPTELINRIDAVVPFAPLQRASYEFIALLRLKEFTNKVWSRHKIKLHFDQKVIKFIIDEHLDKTTDGGGGRGIKRRIDDHIISAVAKMIAYNPDVKDIAISVTGNFYSDNKFDRLGNARIIVGKWNGTKKPSA